jgi:hypothetical protein
VVASAPHPALLIAGLVLFIGGLGAAFVRPNRSAPVSVVAREA